MVYEEFDLVHYAGFAFNESSYSSAYVAVMDLDTVIMLQVGIFVLLLILNVLIIGGFFYGRRF